MSSAGGAPQARPGRLTPCAATVDVKLDKCLRQSHIPQKTVDNLTKQSWTRWEKDGDNKMSDDELIEATSELIVSLRDIMPNMNTPSVELVRSTISRAMEKLDAERDGFFTQFEFQVFMKMLIVKVTGDKGRPQKAGKAKPHRGATLPSRASAAAGRVAVGHAGAASKAAPGMEDQIRSLVESNNVLRRLLLEEREAAAKREAALNRRLDDMAEILRRVANKVLS